MTLLRHPRSRLNVSASGKMSVGGVSCYQVRVKLRCQGMSSRLVATRQRAKLSKNALAKAAEVSQPTIKRLEEGTSYPALDTLERLAIALRVSPAGWPSAWGRRTGKNEWSRLTRRP